MSDRIASPPIPRFLQSRVNGNPIIWIFGGKEKIYFVNNTDRSITKVSGSTAGFTSHDDGVVPYAGKVRFTYTDIKPNEAVMVEELDGYYDLDYLHQLTLTIKDDELGVIEIRTRPAKGEIPSQTLFWRENVPSPKIHVEKLTNPK